MRSKPELLSPAGDMERLKLAVLYGADAVYLAGTSFGMRSFAGNFTPQELPKAVVIKVTVMIFIQFQKSIWIKFHTLFQISWF